MDATAWRAENRPEVKRRLEPCSCADIGKRAGAPPAAVRTSPTCVRAHTHTHTPSKSQMGFHALAIPRELLLVFTFSSTFSRFMVFFLGLVV